jgi:hypothetical protein
LTAKKSDAPKSERNERHDEEADGVCREHSSDCSFRRNWSTLLSSNASILSGYGQRARSSMMRQQRLDERPLRVGERYGGHAAMQGDDSAF